MTIQQTAWVQKGRGRAAVSAGAVTILRANDGTIELFAGDKLLGVAPFAHKHPTLASTAAKLGGHWVRARNDTMVRVESISYWRPDKDGAHMLVDGVAVVASHHYWPHIWRALQ